MVEHITGEAGSRFHDHGNKFEVFKSTYDEITKELLPVVPQDHCPQLSPIIYAIQSIVENSLTLNQAKDLIALLCHVEAIRKELMVHSERILIWNEHYSRIQDLQPHIQLLDQEDKKTVEAFRLKSGPTLRRFFRTAVNGLAKLNILRSSSDGVSQYKDIDFEINQLLQIYFSHYLGETELPPNASAQHKQILWRCFHEDVSVEEKTVLCDAAYAVVNQFIKYSSYSADFDNYCIENNVSPDVASFEQCFPPSVDRGKLEGVINLYLKGVEEYAIGLPTMLVSRTALNSSL